MMRIVMTFLSLLSFCVSSFFSYLPLTPFSSFSHASPPGQLSVRRGAQGYQATRQRHVPLSKRRRLRRRLQGRQLPRRRCALSSTPLLLALRGALPLSNANGSHAYRLF